MLVLFGWEAIDTHWSEMDVSLVLLELMVEFRRHSNLELSIPLSSRARGSLRRTWVMQGILSRIWNSLLNFSCNINLAVALLGVQ